MATAAYYRWVNAGKPWRLARPIADMQAYARQHDVNVLGTIGNGDHLTASTPEDHTPFSATAWPDPLPGYIVTAIDLANVHGLGAAILRDARAGATPWLKYMNFGNKQYSHSDGFKTGRSNPDGHIHLSIRTDHLNTSLAGYDPLGDDMPELKDWAYKDGTFNAPGYGPMGEKLTAAQVAKNEFWSWNSYLRQTLEDLRKTRGEAATGRREQAATNAAILAKLDGQDVTAVVRRELDAAAVRERAERAAEREQLAAELAPGLAEALHNAVGEGLGADAARQVVEDALREVFGSLDEQTS